jgi:hypothetical protein
MIDQNAFPAAEPTLARQFAGSKCPVLASGLKAPVRFSAVRSVVPLALFAMVLASAQASTLTLTYTDYNSDSASLVLTGSIAADGGFEVTNVTGIFNGSPVTGPASDSDFGATSNEFYTDPSTLPVPTPDTGFLFETAGGAIVELYEYNVEINDNLESGFATTVVDPPSPIYSGGVTITSISSSSDAPEPATAAMGFGALLLIAGCRKFAVRRG